MNEPDDNSGVGETDMVHYVYNNDVIYSIVEVTDPNSKDNVKRARLFARSTAGKFVWDFSINESSLQNASERDSLASLFVTPVTSENSNRIKGNSENDKGNSKRQAGTISLFSEGNNGNATDKIDELLQYLSEAHSELLPETQKSLNQPTLLPKQYLTQIVAMQTAFSTQHEEDVKYVIEKNKNKPSSATWAVEPPVTPIPLHANHNCRMILSHLGFLEEDLENIKQIENSKNFLLKLRNLDKCYTREVVKIGLIYVADGQETQEEILRNNFSNSDSYKEFVAGIAWNVEMATHKGYTGGLDPAGSNGKIAPYYANSALELILHEIVKMPTIDDPTQLHKKRHVGNDAVHIVWTEHGREYSPRTITSQFNDAHIIVSPAKNGLFRIQIAKKDKVPLFGPLIHGMAVNKRLLPLLVRQTGINANRYRYAVEGFDKPFYTRHNLIQEIINKCTVKPQYEDYVFSVIKPEGKTRTGASEAPSSPTNTGTLRPSSPEPQRELQQN